MIMLQPRISLHNGLTLCERPKKRIDQLRLHLPKLHLTLINIALIITLLTPHCSAQFVDESYSVQPTPALHLDAEDFTTVLLVSNEGGGRLGDIHGRFLSVRPEIGLLTSTARTFIQEGTTTEYATQVLGTTLDNGRLYAQYLKKSSRILYENEHPSHSVITSWVGDAVNFQTKSLLQSHNDLIDAEAPDWREIDDRLQVDRNNFVGNTDFVRPSVDYISNISNISSIAYKEPANTVTTSLQPISSLALNILGRNNQVEANARKVAAQKVLPIGDLPTYTVKNHYEANIHLSDEKSGNLEQKIQSSSKSNRYDNDLERLPKILYQEMVKDNNGLNVSKSSFITQMLSKRILSTVTYYGFSDFTTIVGDSVIVFSPSTSKQFINIGHVTSIKGEATLDTKSVRNDSATIISQIENVKNVIQASTTTTRIAAIEPTILTETSLAMDHDLAGKEPTNDDGREFENTSEFVKQSILLEAIPSLTKAFTSTTTNVASEVDTSVYLGSKSMLSLPTDEEILQLYSSLALANAVKSTNRIDEIIPSTKMEQNESMEKTASNLQVLGGATTIFFEDDPFTNFVEPTVSEKNTGTKSQSVGAPTTMEGISERQPTTDDFYEITTTMHNEDEDETTTISSEAIAPKVLSYDINTETTTTSDADKTAEKSISEDLIIAMEIMISNNRSDENCSRTSQVYFTQIPKTVTVTNTHVFTTSQVTAKSANLTSIETSVLSTFVMDQITKHFCIQPSVVSQNDHTDQIEKPIHQEQQETANAFTGTEADIDKETTTEQLNIKITTTSSENGIESDYAEDYDSDHVVLDNNDDDSVEEIELIYKTLYTTYTYLTTFFQDDATTISSHTEVVTNVITSTIGTDDSVTPTETLKVNEGVKIDQTTSQFQQNKAVASKYMVPQEVDSFVRSEQATEKLEEETVEGTEFLNDSKYTQTYFTTYTYYTTIFAEGDTEIMSRTEVFTNFVTTDHISIKSVKVDPSSSIKSQITSQIQQKNSDNDIEAITLVTDVRSSSSLGEQHVINKENEPVDDQVSSESNTDAIIPSATLLLQTSFTTFTYFTTMYLGESTNIISRLDTVTNVATETLQPTKSISAAEATLPITYFTTFTYWTKLAKNGEITTISREETISNVVLPTITDSASNSLLSNFNQEDHKTVTTINQTETFESSVIEPTTYFTTYTYYTTSYDLDSTITDSRFETITNIVTPTVKSSPHDDLTSVMDSKVTTNPNESNIIPTNSPNSLIVYDYKKIIDADGVSTLYFTTEVSPSVGIDGFTTEITTTSSNLNINHTRKSLQVTPSESIYENNTSKQYKTGLVRLIEGTRIGNNTTTLYQSKVIGTLIENRYAQIIESTSSFLFEKINSDILPSSTTENLILTTGLVDLQTTNLAGVQSSIGDVGNKDIAEEVSKEHEDVVASDENTVQNFSQLKKRTFAPVIRPFASRNRPTFAPKQKTPSHSSATIITRSDITPTITATPALKTNGRYVSSRRGSISNAPINPNEVSSSKRFGRPIAGQSNSGFAPSKSRFQSGRILPSSSNSKRPSASFKQSSGLSLRSGFSSLNLSRQRIRPTTLGEVLASTYAATLAAKNGEDESSTQEQPNNEEEITTENSRRNQNPLLRFRRPLNRPAGFIPGQNQKLNTNGVTISPKKNPLSARSKAPTTTSTTTTTTRPRPHSFQRPALTSLQSRARVQNNLFPPRGLLQTQKSQNQYSTDDKKDKNTDDSSDDVDNDAENDSEYDDEDDADEDGEEDGNRRRRSSLINNLSNTPRSRNRRQVDSAPINRNRFRFRRPKTVTTTTEDTSDIEEADTMTHNKHPPTSSMRNRTGSRYGSRYQLSQPQHSSTSTMATTSNHRAIRPTRPVRTQFTLREKDTTTPRGITRPGTSANFRRHSTGTPSSFRRPTISTSSNRRLKSYNGNNNADNSVRSTGTTRQRNGNLNGSGRSRGSVRGRIRNEHNNDQPGPVEIGSSTITVTYVIPAEVTIPVVNGQITEYKNIVTGKTSTEVIGPSQYTSILGSNGLTSLLLTREDTSVNFAGATEITKFLLHDSATTTITFTPTTIRGRKTSFSHVLPSTVYSVENVISTLQPQISANAPLANILLSQLLLGNIGLPTNPLLGALGGAGFSQQPLTNGQIAPIQAMPITEYRTHTSTYVTTIFDGTSTIVPVTFQGKKILTTVYDTTAQTITATEFITDTIVTTPIQQQFQQPSTGQIAQVNSLLLQQLLLQQQPFVDQTQKQTTHTSSPQIFLTENLQDLDVHHNQLRSGSQNLDEIEEFVPIVEETQNYKGGRKKSRKSGKAHKKNKQVHETTDHESASIVTIYVSGRRPGEFSTILSTVQNEYNHVASLHKRQATDQIQQTILMDSLRDVYESEGSDTDTQYMLPVKNNDIFVFSSNEDSPNGQIDHSLNNLQTKRNALSKESEINGHKMQTVSLESIVGDVSYWYSKLNKQENSFSTRFNQGQQVYTKHLKITSLPLTNQYDKDTNFLV